MSIVFACAGCKSRIETPSSVAGKRGKCHKCGQINTVPPAASKICRSCGIDVANQPRTKDGTGNYFCQPCWNSRIAEAKSVVDLAEQTPPEEYDIPTPPEPPPFISPAPPPTNLLPPRHRAKKRWLYVALSVIGLSVIAAIGFAIYETHQLSYRIRGKWENAQHSSTMTVSSAAIQIDTPDGQMDLSYKVVDEADDKINVAILSGPTKWEDPTSIRYNANDDSIWVTLIGERPDGDGTYSVVNLAGEWDRKKN
jgi:hypothetical protein